MSAPASRKSNGPALTIGLAAFGGGLWLLLNAMGVNIPQFKDIWPGLLILAGLGALADFFFLGRRPGSVGWAVTWICFGVLAFALTLNYTTWGKILDWLPSFPTILGLALLATWLADQRRSDNHMIAGVILVALGLLGYGARFDWLQSILPSAQVVWAILLLIGGAFLVWRTVLRSK